MFEFLSPLTDSKVFQDTKKQLDQIGIVDTMVTAANSVKSTPGEGLVDTFVPGLSPTSDGLSVIMGTLDLMKARDNATKYMEDGDGVALMDAIHDGLTGTAGLVGLDKGPGGAVAKAAAAGLAVGDMIAPTVFGSEKEDNANSGYQDATEEFKPTTGNRYYDFMLDLYGITD